MLPYCPKCGKECKVSATHHREKTLVCLKCGQGWRTGINGTKSYKRGIMFDFSNVVEEMIVTCMGREVRLPPVAVAVTQEKGRFAATE